MMNTKDLFIYQKGTATFAETLEHSEFSHVRFDEPWECFRHGNSEFRPGPFKVYFRCSDSPSGVLLAASFHATPENKAIMAAHNQRANLGPSRGQIAQSRGVSTIGF